MFMHFVSEAVRDNLVAYLFGCLAFVGTLAVWSSLIQRDPNSVRVQMIADQRRQLLERKDKLSSRRRTPADLKSLARFGRKLRMFQIAQIDRVRDKLLRAGYRSRDAMPVLVAAKVVLAALAGIAAFLLINVAELVAVPAGAASASPVLGLVGGFFLPDLQLANRIKRRRAALQKSLPDGLDLLVVCAEAGLSLDTALARVSEEMAAAAPDLADELALTALELGFLPDRRAALLNLGKRCDIPVIRGVVNTLVQTERYGTPLSQALRVLSADFREERMMRAEEKAARLPAILTVPMIVFILPTLFIVLGGPAVISVYESMMQ